MKLLIVTQVIDKEDPTLGFFHRWIEVFAAQVEHLEVICLKEGTHSLPANVRVHSLGKEHGDRSRIAYAWHFIRLAVSLRPNYDAVFVHMNPEYLLIGGPFWILRRVPVVLWYTHKSVPLSLRLGSFFAKTIFTSSPESLRLYTRKKSPIGHGIDMEQFKFESRTPGPVLQIVSVGRITPIKDLATLIRAVSLLSQKGIALHLRLIGDTPAVGDVEYKRKLEDQIQKLSLGEKVEFTGGVPFSEIRAAYESSDVSVNLCPTGGMDKAVLESWASGTPALVANTAFSSLLGSDKELFMFPEGDAEALAHKLERIYTNRPDAEILCVTREVREKFSIGTLVTTILQGLRK